MAKVPEDSPIRDGTQGSNAEKIISESSRHLQIPSKITIEMTLQAITAYNPPHFHFSASVGRGGRESVP
jgi:hypothetical protein